MPDNASGPQNTGEFTVDMSRVMCLHNTRFSNAAVNPHILPNILCKCLLHTVADSVCKARLAAGRAG